MVRLGIRTALERSMCTESLGVLPRLHPFLGVAHELRKLLGRPPRDEVDETVRRRPGELGFLEVHSLVSTRNQPLAGSRCRADSRQDVLREPTLLVLGALENLELRQPLSRGIENVSSKLGGTMLLENQLFVPLVFHLVHQPRSNGRIPDLVAVFAFFSEPFRQPLVNALERLVGSALALGHRRLEPLACANSFVTRRSP